MEHEPSSAGLRLLSEAATCDSQADRLGVLLLATTEEPSWPRLVLWFDNPLAFGQFLVEALPEFYCGEDDVGDLVERLESLLPAMVADGVTQELLDELDSWLNRWVTIAWLGSFGDLCIADTEATARVVEAFRMDQGQDGADPVLPDEADDFADYLTLWFEG